MKRLITKFFVIMILICTTFTLFACGNDIANNGSSETSVHNKDNNLVNGNNIVVYSDSDTVKTDDIELKISQPSCNETNDYSLSVHFTLTNKTNSTKEYKIQNVSLIREATGSSYTVKYTSSLRIDSEISQRLDFTSTIPTSIKNESYKLYFEINTYKITCYLSETPDSLRADRKINYYIDNKLVKTEVVKDKRKIESKYIYESEDNLYYCDNWYSDANKTNQFNFSISITQDINLHGNKMSNLRWATTSTDVYSFVNGINHVSSNGILVIPSKYANKEICIGVSVITRINATKIYIPKTVHTIYYGNFTNLPSGATIYYEGTEEEWRNLFYSSSDIITANVVYNTKYQG